MTDDGTTLSLPPEAHSADSTASHTTYLRLVYAQGAGRDSDILDQILPFGRGDKRTLRMGRKPTHPDGGRTLTMGFDSWASRDHAHIKHLPVGRESGLVIEDLGSRNGTFVQGQRVQGSVIARVGQVVRVGGTVFVVGQAPLERAAFIRADSPPPEDFDVRTWCAMELWERLVALSKTDYGVLLLGEMGTGKTRLARHIHRLSARCDRPFASFNASAIPHNLEEATLFGVVGGFIPGVKEKQGWITTARDGTLFLDELADLPSLAQAKLLDAFDPTDPSFVAVGGSRRITTRCRLVTATNRDVFVLAADGVIRQDLLSRLVTSQVTVPPLRKRLEDLLPMFGAALERAGLERGPDEPVVKSGELAEALLTAHWTENVRGLESLAARVGAGERLTISLAREHADRGRAPTPSAAPPAPLEIAAQPTPPGWPPTPEELLQLLATHRWRVKEAAESIGRRRETVSRVVSRIFGSRDAAKKAHEVWRASARVPPAEHIEALHALYADRAPSKAALSAREKWRTDGIVS